MNHPITHSPAVDRVMSRVVYLEERRKLQQAANRDWPTPLPFVLTATFLISTLQFWVAVLKQIEEGR
jgi:hypothetical protein